MEHILAWVPRDALWDRFVHGCFRNIFGAEGGLGNKEDMIWGSIKAGLVVLAFLALAVCLSCFFNREYMSGMI